MKTIILIFLLSLTLTMNEYDYVQELSSLVVQEPPTLVYYPDAIYSVPDEYMDQFSKYVDDNLTLMGTLMFNACLTDVTGDGKADICATFATGSGIISYLIIAYDMEEEQGYMLHDRGDYDYMITGVDDRELIVERTTFGTDRTAVTGTVYVRSGQLVFDETE